jgi:hypothetical protein
VQRANVYDTISRAIKEYECRNEPDSFIRELDFEIYESYTKIRLHNCILNHSFMFTKLIYGEPLRYILQRLKEKWKYLCQIIQNGLTSSNRLNDYKNGYKMTFNT